LIRPASVAFYNDIRKLDLMEFSRDFAECHVDPIEINDLLWGLDGQEIILIN
jgi:hypothetical protein